MRSSASSNHSPRGSKTKFFHIQFSDLHVSKEDLVEIWCDQLKSQLFKPKYFANEYPSFVPADVAAVVHPSEKNTLRVLVVSGLFCNGSAKYAQLPRANKLATGNPHFVKVPAPSALSLRQNLTKYCPGICNDISFSVADKQAVKEAGGEQSIGIGCVAGHSLAGCQHDLAVPVAANVESGVLNSTLLVAAQGVNGAIMRPPLHDWELILERVEHSCVCGTIQQEEHRPREHVRQLKRDKNPVRGVGSVGNP
jgi:hypothetical protein